jgi:hypothetical protein
MVMTDFGMVILVNEEHPWKAFFPMLVTEAGMTMLCKLMNPLKALSPMVVTVSGILLIELYLVLLYPDNPSCS